MKDTKIAPMIYRTVKGWRVGARVRAEGAARGVRGTLKWQRIEDSEHKKSVPELKRLRDAWKVDAGRLVTGGVIVLDGSQGIAEDVEVYVTLPQIKKLVVAKRGERQMQVRLLAQRIGPQRPRLSIKKLEWERLLGTLQHEREWSAETFNKWLTSLKSLYTTLRDPDVAQPNAPSHIAYQEPPEALARNLPPETVDNLLARLVPSAKDRNKVSYQSDQLARRLSREGESNAEIGKTIGVSETAVRKLLRRAPLAEARQSERIALALRAIASTGVRPSQFEKITKDNFDLANRCVWIPKSDKGDNSTKRPLTDEGIAAFQAVFDAKATGTYDRSDARRMWKAVCVAEGLKKPYPRPYDLRHTHFTEAALAGASPEELILYTGHKSVKSVMRYANAAVNAIARRVADGVEARTKTHRAATAAAKVAAAKATNVTVLRPKGTTARRAERGTKKKKA